MTSFSLEKRIYRVIVTIGLLFCLVSVSEWMYSVFLDMCECAVY